jgi:restriction system protein
MTRWLLPVLVAACAGAWFGHGELRLTALVAIALCLTAIVLRVRRHIRRRAAVRTVDGLRLLHPDDFEAEVGRWLRRDGWQVEHRGGTGDGGIDIVARRGKETLAVQCKRYAETAAVSAAQVRDLYGAAVAEGSTRAVLITTGRVSRAAASWCEALPEAPAFQLFDAEAVAELAAGRARISA